MGTQRYPSRMLIIGLDVGDGTLIRAWAQQGHLPVLHSCITRGTWGWLSTPAELLHVAAWPSLYTGTLPGTHGVYYTYQPTPGQQGARRFGANQYGAPPFWQSLSSAGQRCIVFDAPYTHPANHFRGLQVFEWGTWACYWKPMATPPRLWRQLRRHCGAYPLGLEANRVGLGALDPVALHQGLTRAVASKARAVQWLMTQAPWDLFLVVFGETHPAAHYCWPAARSAVVASDETPAGLLRRVYEAVDQAIGDILATLGEDVTVLIVSGDGVGPNYSGWHLLPEVLQRLGWTVAPGQAQPATTGQAGPGQSRQDVFKMLRDLVPAELRHTLSGYLPMRWREACMLRWATTAIDWPRTRAFCLPTDLEGCIRINLKGREPAGSVAPGAEYDAVCQSLTGSLQQLLNPSTGRPAVRQVLRVDAVFPGARRHALPDLIVLWSDEAAITAVSSPELGTVRAASPDARPGTHRPPGFILARGPGIPTGQMVAGGHLVDIAPTVLAHFGVSGFQHMDGRVWNAILSK